MKKNQKRYGVLLFKYRKIKGEWLIVKSSEVLYTVWSTSPKAAVLDVVKAKCPDDWESFGMTITEHPPEDEE